MKPELIEKAKTAKTAEELFELAKANGVEITEDDAKTDFVQLNPKCGELADDELDNVAGGGCGDPSEPPKFQIGEHVLEIGLNQCDLLYPVACRSTHWVVDRIRYTERYEYTVHCPICNRVTEEWESFLVKK